MNRASLVKAAAALSETNSDDLKGVPTTPLSGVDSDNAYLQHQNLSISRRGTNTERNRGNSHLRQQSQIDQLLSMSQMCSDNKRPSFAMKYLNTSSFDTHTRDLVKLVTKFSVLVVWSAITSILAAIFFISFIVGFDDNVILHNISASYITLITCFIEMHVVYLQLNGTEKWYKCLCGLCHNAWGKCCVCKLRRRLVRKIGKQHKELTLKANGSLDEEKVKRQQNGQTMIVKLKNRVSNSTNNGNGNGKRISYKE